MSEKNGMYSQISKYSELYKKLNSIFSSIITSKSFSEQDIYSPYDIFIENNLLVIEIEMPGFSKEDINIVSVDKFIEISGIKDTKKTKYENCITLERTNGKFSRLIYVPQPVNINQAEADMKNGILTISIPLIEEKRWLKTKKIIIN
jgi:HSP20 family protein